MIVGERIVVWDILPKTNIATRKKKQSPKWKVVSQLPFFLGELLVFGNVLVCLV